MKSLHASLKYINKQLYIGHDVNTDRINLENHISQIQEQSWFFCKDQDDLDWILKEGTMNPQFLHLEDEKANIFLESLLIDGEETSTIDPVLTEIFSYYLNLYSNQDI